MEGTPVAAVLVFDFLLLGVVLFGSGAKGNERGQSALVAALFFCSGFPALIYQIVWQRALFAIYGVNVQSVAVVVSAFMLGLGIGSLVGGRLSQRFPRSGILIFGICELGVAGFGLVSLRLFHWAATRTAGSSLGFTILFSFLLLIVPTVLMGATLPLLVEQLVRTFQERGVLGGDAVFRQHAWVRSGVLRLRGGAAARLWTVGVSHGCGMHQHPGRRDRLLVREKREFRGKEFNSRSRAEERSCRHARATCSGVDRRGRRASSRSDSRLRGSASSRSPLTIARLPLRCCSPRTWRASPPDLS